MIKSKKLNLNIFILPVLNVLMFIILSDFGQSFMMGIGLSFIFALIFMLVYIINIKKIPNKINIAFLILFIYSFISSLIAMDLYYGIISIGTVSSFSLLVNLKLSDDEWKKSFMITSLFSTGILILYNLKYVLVNWNPNSLGGFCLLGMLMSIFALFIENKKKKKFIIFLFILYQIVQLYLTDCRTATLIFILALIFSFYFITFHHGKTIKVYSIYLLVCLSFTLLATQYMKFINSDYSKWMIDISIQLFNKPTLFSDRETIWNICSYLVKDFEIFGCGKSLYYLIYSHNMFYSIQYTYGLVGYILYSAYLFITCTYVRDHSTNKIIPYISIVIFASILIGQITENTMFTSDSNIFMSYILLSIGLSTVVNKGGD